MDLRRSTEIPVNLVKSITQPLKSAASALAKKQNLSIALNKLDGLQICPGQVFSFWHLVGDPSKKNGYQKSRTIINGQLQEEVGGGLCQLSGLIYYLALHAGLNILERHPHSLDIYSEEERFTPLGSDATVVYGYKDLRFINTLTTPVTFQFELTDSALKGKLYAAQMLEPFTIQFEYEADDGYTRVTAFAARNDTRSLISSSRYRKWNG
ncbi:MAG: VanW family protein [Chitinophagaceae bacterium]|nr:VanW family protein [Chitinophagaceae bacterium]MBL0055829.1 VanW family protein [Chitinophagaceae bacterium]